MKALKVFNQVCILKSNKNAVKVSNIALFGYCRLIFETIKNEREIK